MRIRDVVVPVLILAVAAAVTPWNSVAVARGSKANQPAPIPGDVKTYEGKVVSVDADTGVLSIRGDDGFKTFEASSKDLAKVSARQRVSVIYKSKDGVNQVLRVSVGSESEPSGPSQKTSGDNTRKQQGRAKDATAAP